MDKTKTYEILDLWKFVMAICVIAIHTHPLDSCENQIIILFYNAFVRLAVPFFFLCSGFLLGNKIGAPFNKDTNLAIIMKYTKRNFFLYCIWTAIYFPLTVYGYYIGTNSFVQNIFSFFKYLFFVGEHHNSYILWYLLSTIYVGFFLFFALKLQISIKTILIISILLFVFGNLITYFSSIPEAHTNIFVKLYSKVFVNGRLLNGFLYITAGLCIALIKPEFFQKNLLFIIFITALSGYLIVPSIIASFFLAVSAISGFILLLRFPGGGIYGPNLLYFFRKTSTVMYFTHLMIWSLFSFLMSGTSVFYGALSFFVTVFSTIMLSCFCFLIKNKNIKRLVEKIF